MADDALHCVDALVEFSNQRQDCERLGAVPMFTSRQSEMGSLLLSQVCGKVFEQGNCVLQRSIKHKARSMSHTKSEHTEPRGLARLIAESSPSSPFAP
jgi:hypothetical protein